MSIVCLFYCGRPPPKPYEKQWLTSGKYRNFSYGTIHFRSYEEADDEVAKDGRLPSIGPAERFRNVVRRIPVFDKLNKEYIEGYLEV
ncbi:unnamed protein product [Protopolystoma xenopodis]|uniref:Uncharacterized protein n=1 Tax=Protopolystoma xenopodis TaxID=117903 RepID=A0A448WHB6_9PLAT|nr:unnamed protein product [Protopolystoma xenopodis]